MAMTYGDPSYRPPQTAGKATAALVFSILAWIVCPIVFAIVALVLAGSAAREIRASQGRLTGEGLVTASRIIAWINVALVGVAFLAVVAITFLGNSANDKFSRIGNELEPRVVLAP